MDVILAAAPPIFHRVATERLVTALERELAAAAHRVERVRLPWGADGSESLEDLQALSLLEMPGQVQGERVLCALDLAAFVWSPQARCALWLCGALGPPADPLRRSAWVATVEGRVALGRFAISASVAQLARRHYALDLEVLYPPLPAIAPAEVEGNYFLLPRFASIAERPALVLAGLARAGAGVRLMVTGSPPAEQAAWRQQALELGIGDLILLREAPAEQLVGACLGVVIAGEPTVDAAAALLALAAGKPAVATRDSGAPLELVVDGVNGCVVQPEPEALGAALSRLALDAELRARLAAGAMTQAAAIPTWRQVLRRLIGEVACAS